MEQLLTFKEYIKIDHPTPYFYVVNKKGKQLLYYFGAAHDFDPTHSQFKILEKKWRDFINKTGKKNCILLIECLIDDFKIGKPTDIIIKYGEPGFAIFLATKDKINFICPEPPIKAQVKKLLKLYDLKEIIYFYFIQTLGQWYKLKNKPRFEKYITLILQQLKKEFNWLNFDISLKNMKEAHRNIFGKELKKEDKQTIKNAASPVKYNSIINEITRSNSMFRNKYIVQEIKKLWNDGKNIFIVYGASHAVIQRKELEKLANKSAVRNRRHKF